MLLLIEHDRIMSTPQARQRLADFVAERPGLNVAIFHSAKLKSKEVRAAYPIALRDRLTITPATPRERNLGYFLTYEICCITSALKFTGKMAHDAPWLCVVPPEWDYPLSHQFGEDRLVVIEGTFGPADADLLDDLVQCDDPGTLSKDSASSISAGVIILMHGSRRPSLSVLQTHSPVRHAAHR